MNKPFFASRQWHSIFCLTVFFVFVAVLIGVALHTPPAPGQGALGTTPMADNKACTDCHKDFLKEELVVQHQVANAGCVKCHGASKIHLGDKTKPKTSPPDKMFTRMTLDKMCRKCHEVEDHVVNSRNAITRWLARNPDGKVPTGTTVCNDCHGAHKRPDRKVHWDAETKKRTLRSDTFPPKVEEKVPNPEKPYVLRKVVVSDNPWGPPPPVLANNDACVKCHKEFEKEEMVHEHRFGNAGCVRCHGDSKKHAADPEKGKSVPPDKMYTRENMTAMCIECHKDFDKVHKTEKGLNGFAGKDFVAKWLKKNTDKLDDADAPERKPACYDCHGHHKLKKRTVTWEK